jgi:hypothetical protein
MVELMGFEPTTSLSANQASFADFSARAKYGPKCAYNCLLLTNGAKVKNAFYLC